MELTKEKKKRLKELLFDISTEAERKDLGALEMSALNDKFSEAMEKFGGIDRSIENVSQKVDKVKSSSSKATFQSGENVERLAQVLATKIDELKEITKKHDPELLTVPLYKSMINAISGVNQSIIDKPTPVWRWPQYASVSVRNKSFANINPAVDGFNIGSYDNIVLGYTGDNITTVTYSAEGRTVAVLTLAYTGDNLTQITRSQ